MNHDNSKAFGPLAALDNQAPFAEPWQAQVMALAFAASGNGVFSPAQWSEALGRELRWKEADAPPDDRAIYYQAALRALETLLLASGKLTCETVKRREAAWRQAYLDTPHGMPVELRLSAP